MDILSGLILLVVIVIGLFEAGAGPPETPGSVSDLTGDDRLEPPE